MHVLIWKSEEDFGIKKSYQILYAGWFIHSFWSSIFLINDFISDLGRFEEFYNNGSYIAKCGAYGSKRQ